MVGIKIVVVVVVVKHWLDFLPDLHVSHSSIQFNFCLGGANTLADGSSFLNCI
jgi:hypothetical protein